MTPASDAEVRVELWTSFLSVLRSYTVAASQGGIEHAVSDIAECEVFITAEQQVLNIWCFPPTGVGEWALDRLEDDPRGEFRLNTDGTISLNGLGLDMDHAAIDLIALLTNAAARVKMIEVPA